MGESVYVVARCVACGKTREIAPNGVDRFSVPMCPDCFSPMVAESAERSSEQSANAPASAATNQTPARESDA